MQIVAAAKLADLVAAIMRGAGCGEGEAATVARRLVDSNLVGHDSHGVLRVPRYLDWIKDGTLKPNTPPTIVFDSDTIAIIDGNRGFGQVVGEFATNLGIAKAAKTGIAMIGLRNCGHLGRLGDWAEVGAWLAVLVGDEWPDVKVKMLATRQEERILHTGLADWLRNRQKDL
jgi:uncharacterized oxidoreductase